MRESWNAQQQAAVLVHILRTTSAACGSTAKTQWRTCAALHGSVWQEQEFKDDLLKRTAPNGAELDSADFRLLSSGLPMSAAEFSALCERNASNETVLRAAGSYAAQHDMIPYFRQYYRTPTERVDAFSHIIKTARVALDAQRQYCSALDPKHWACVTGDDAKVIGPSADYYKGKTGSSSTAAPSAAGAASTTTWSAQDSTINGVV